MTDEYNSDDHISTLYGQIDKLEEQRDQFAEDRRELMEALEKITKFDDPPRYRVDVNTAYSVAVGAINIARDALQEARYEE